MKFTQNNPGIFLSVIGVFFLIIVFLTLNPGFSQSDNNPAFTWKEKNSLIEWDAEKHTGTMPLSIESMKLDEKGIPVSGRVKLHMDSLMDNDIEYELMQQVLENTLKSEEWFDTKNHPIGYFEIDSLTSTDNPDIFIVQGKLTIKEKTKNLSFFCIVQKEGNSVHIQSECIGFNRILWGVDTWSASTATGEEEMIVSDIFNIEVNLRYELL